MARLLGEAFVSVGADLTALKTGFATAEKITKLSVGKIASIATLAGTAFISLAGAVGATILAYSRFEQAMANVQSIVWATSEDLKSLSRTALTVATDFNFSAVTGAKAMYYLASAGYNTKQIMDTFPPIIKLARATLADLEMTSETVVNTINSFGLSTSEAERVVNVFAATIRSSQATLEKLRVSFGYVAPIAAIAGLTIEETAAALGLLYNRGLQASIAGTGLRMSLARLSRPTRQAHITLKELGLTAADINPEINDLADIIDKLNEKQTDLADLSTLVGVRAATTLANLLKVGGDAMREYTQRITGTNSASKMAATQMDTLQASIKDLLVSFETFIILIGEKFKPEIIWFRDLLEHLITYMKSLDSESLKDIKSFLKFAVVISGVVAGLTLLGATFGPVLAAVFSYKTAAVAANVAAGASAAASIPAINGVAAAWAGAAEMAGLYTTTATFGAVGGPLGIGTTAGAWGAGGGIVGGTGMAAAGGGAAVAGGGAAGGGAAVAGGGAAGAGSLGASISAALGPALIAAVVVIAVGAFIKYGLPLLLSWKSSLTAERSSRKAKSIIEQNIRRTQLFESGLTSEWALAGIERKGWKDTKIWKAALDDAKASVAAINKEFGRGSATLDEETGKIKYFGNAAAEAQKLVESQTTPAEGAIAGYNKILELQNRIGKALMEITDMEDVTGEKAMREIGRIYNTIEEEHINLTKNKYDAARKLEERAHKATTSELQDRLDIIDAIDSQLGLTDLLTLNEEELHALNQKHIQLVEEREKVYAHLQTERERHATAQEDILHDQYLEEIQLAKDADEYRESLENAYVRMVLQKQDKLKNAILKVDDEILRMRGENAKLGAIQLQREIENLFTLGATSDQLKEYTQLSLKEISKRTGISQKFGRPGAGLAGQMGLTFKTFGKVPSPEEIIAQALEASKNASKERKDQVKAIQEVTATLKNETIQVELVGDSLGLQ